MFSEVMAGMTIFNLHMAYAHFERLYAASSVFLYKHRTKCDMLWQILIFFLPFMMIYLYF